MHTKLPQFFLDSGNPEDTRKIKSLMGFLDGQTTNPSLIAKNPEVVSYVSKGKKLTESELFGIYKNIIKEIQSIISGPISAEIYADLNTTQEKILEQAFEMKNWGNNIYVKFPAIPTGIMAAHEFVKQKGKANVTLVFDQQQAAAIYFATLPAFYPTYISPFIGRLDDRGYKGVDLIKNIKKMYDGFNLKHNKVESHVKILSASVRNLDHFNSTILLGTDAITAPVTVYEAWVSQGKTVLNPENAPKYDTLRDIAYDNISPDPDFTSYKIDLSKETLLYEGLDKFVKDWQNLLH
jgi:transaldolase